MNNDPFRTWTFPFFSVWYSCGISSLAVTERFIVFNSVYVEKGLGGDNGSGSKPSFGLLLTQLSPSTWDITTPWNSLLQDIVENNHLSG